MRIAMWSGPRNLSTAMMYAFGSRADCAVWDEPFYAPYLKWGHKQHPMQDVIFEREETNPHDVAKRCIGPIPNGKQIFYQKHMPHHMLDNFPLDWLTGVCNVFLIRHPARVIASYSKKNGAPTLDDIGIKKQAALFTKILEDSGQTPIVVDSSDIRMDPSVILAKLCSTIGIDWDPAMLSWPEGGHPNDGAWAPHWYPEVWKSTGFAPAEPPVPDTPDALHPVLNDAMIFYNQLAQHKLQP